MARTLVIELPDDLERQVLSQAEAEQVSPEAWVLKFVSQSLSQAVQPESPSTETRVSERQELMQFAGTISLGYATGLDNEMIDADLARAYENDY